MKKQVMLVVTSTALMSLVVAGTGYAEEVGTIRSNGLVEFMPSTDITEPVDPTIDPKEPPVTVKPIDPTDPTGPHPGTKGPLSIDYASSLDFGKNRITNVDMTYYARAQAYHGDTEETPNYIQVTDNRGTNAGWTLKVKQAGQLKSVTETLNPELTGSVITLTQPTVNSNSTATAPTAAQTIVLDPAGSEQLVMSAATKAGAGTWTNRWGIVERVMEQDQAGQEVEASVTKDVTLEVPGATPKDAVKYQTQLIWTLSDVPGN